MRLALVRARFLAALGLPVFAAAACSGSGSEPVWPTPPKQSHSGPWIPQLPQKEDSGDRLPSCPSGPFCVPASATAPDKPAAAPFESCASAVEAPAELQLGPPGSIQVGFWDKLTQHERQGDPAACCYNWWQPCPGGRPLRGREGEVVAETVQRDGWVAGAAAIAVKDIAVDGLSTDKRALLAAHWAQEAAFEHASVASFGRAALALLSHGAPSDLVARAHMAAAEEVEHARVGYALSSAYSGEVRGPGPLPVADLAPLPGTLAALAVETFLDGCVNETVAALTLAEAADRTKGATLRSLLRGIASDEERHAELGWLTVGWAVRAGGADVIAALERAVAGVKAELSSPAPRPPAGEPDGTAHGVLSAAARLATRRAALAQVIVPCAEALLASASRRSVGILLSPSRIAAS